MTDSKCPSTSFSSTNSSSENTSCSPATLLLNSGIPGYSYTFVDPNEQYQKYLCVVLQALSGTDPLHPPDLSPTITDVGMSLTVQIPISPVFLSTDLMVHRNVSWMNSNNDNEYNSKRQTRLGGLGPVIAQVKGNTPSSPPPSIEWTIPLSERCDELVGSYSINNFPAERNQYNQTFYPILMEFKLTTVEQNVKKESKINSGLWVDDSTSCTTNNSSTGATKGTNEHKWYFNK